GDRIRWTIPGSDDNESYEIVVAAVTRDEGWVIDSESSSYYFKYGAVVDRIPAPVVHPDTEEHPVIIIRGGDFYDGIPMPQDAIWTGTSYESRTHSFQPGDITDWEPADIV